MTSQQWERVRDQVADLVAEGLDLQDDLVVSEVRTSDSLEEALGRMASIRDDAAEAINIILSFKRRRGPKDWTPGKRR